MLSVLTLLTSLNSCCNPYIYLGFTGSRVCQRPESTYRRHQRISQRAHKDAHGERLHDRGGVGGLLRTMLSCLRKLCPTRLEYPTFDVTEESNNMASSSSTGSLSANVRADSVIRAHLIGGDQSERGITMNSYRSLSDVGPTRTIRNPYPDVMTRSAVGMTSSR